MAFREVISLDADVTVALGKKDKATGKAYPKEAEGYYLGSRTVQNKRGPGLIHFLQTAAGNLGIWGTTDMNKKLGQVTPGTMVRITSTGTKPTPNGDMYTYRVAVDADNIIDVGNLASESSLVIEDEQTSADLDDSSDNGYDANGGTTNGQVVTTVDEAIALTAAAAERKAKVEALLRNTRKSTK